VPCRLHTDFSSFWATYQANKPSLIFFEFNGLADALEAVHRITVARDIVWQIACNNGTTIGRGEIPSC
jgi:hypothetical protein